MLRFACLAAVLAIVSPAHAERPTAATKDLLLELAAKRARVIELVDPAMGLVFLDHFLEPGEPPGTTSEQHLCGGAIQKLLKTVWIQEIGPAITAARDNKSLVCTSTTECSAGGRGEWDTVWHFKFIKDKAGKLFLRAVTEDDEVLVDPAEVAKEHAGQTKVIDKLAVRCK
jgi:hypothetical protein